MYFALGPKSLDLDDFTGIPKVIVEMTTLYRNPSLKITGTSPDTDILVSVSTTVHYEGELASKLIVETEPGDRVGLDSGIFRHVELKSGALTARANNSVRRLSLFTNASLTFNVEELELCRDGLTITVGGGGVSVDKIAVSEATPHPNLKLQSDKSNRGDYPLIQGAIIDGPDTLRLDKVALLINETKHQITISGDGIVQVPQRQTLTGLTVIDNPDHPLISLDLGAASSIRDFAGTCFIKRAVGASIIAVHDQSFDYVGVDPTPNRRGEDPLENATLRGAQIKPSSAGRDRIGELANVRVFEPVIDHDTYPPGWRRPFHSLHRLKSRAAGRPDRQTAADHLLDCAYFCKELDVLVTEKCGAGSIRSKVAWGRARAQHLTSGRVERWMYSLFRLVGYGQRPIPPLLTWLAIGSLTMFVAMWMEVDAHSYQGGMLALWVHMLFTPFVLLRFTAETQASGTDVLAGLGVMERQVVLLLQVLVVAAFVSFIAALRNYMRSSLPS